MIKFLTFQIGYCVSLDMYDVEVQRDGLAALLNLAFDANNRMSIAEAGGIAVVLEALRTHPKDVEVQRKGLGALGNLALDDDNERSIV